MQKVLYILSELTDSDLEWLIRTGKCDKVSQGTVLIHEGKPITAVFIVLQGMLSVQLVEKGNLELARLGEGEVVGEMSFLDSSPPSATVIAAQDSIVLTVPRAQLLAKLVQDSGLASRFYRSLALFLSDRLRHTNWHLAYGPGRMPGDDPHAQPAQSPAVKEGAPAAGDRFNRMLKRLLA